MKILSGWLKSILKYFSSSISKKIVTPYALLTLVLAAMGIFVITQLVATSFEERLKNQLLEAGRVVSDEVVNRERRRLEIERVVANTIGVADALIDQDIAKLDELISPVIANANIIDSIIIVDTQSKEVLRFKRVATGPENFVETESDTGSDLSDWVAVQEVLENPDGFKQIQLAQDEALNELIIYTVGPITGSDGNVVGAVLVGTFLDSEVAVLRELALAQLILFDRNSAILATTFALAEEDKVEIHKVFTPGRYQQIIQQNRNDVTLLDQVQLPAPEGAEDRSYRLAYAPFILRGREVGIYAVALPTNFITETTNQSRNLLIVIFSIGVVTVFGVGFFIAHRITRPISRLARTSQAISAGDLDQRSGLKREDEIGILATAFDDMTAELQRLLKIQEEEASKLNAILNSIADGVIVQDIDGKILVMNPAAKGILEEISHNFAQSPLQSLNNEKVELPGSDSYTSFLLNRLTGLEFREAQRFDIGRQVLSALSAAVFTSENTQLGSVVVLRDITREVESERLKDEFITSISHELKTPLTAIKGYNNLLKMMLEMGSDSEMSDRQLSIVDTMDKEATDLDNIIQAMLDLSQIDAGELGIDQVPVDLAELIKAETGEWVDKMEERELSFKFVFPDESIWVEGDHNRLTRVAHNLIKNAHDYTLPSGTVEVLVKQENGRGQVEVRDTGVGIREEDQRFLFTKFFRAIHEESHFGEVSGAGLGLYTSRAIVEAHEGEMWMESELNRGSVFSFALPVIEPDFDEELWSEEVEVSVED